MTTTRATVKKRLIAECVAKMAGKRNFKFISKGFGLMVRPVAKLTVDGYLFKLRCTDNFDSPFIEDQHAADGEVIEVHTLDFDDNELHLSEMQRCKVMYMLLNYLNASREGNYNTSISFRLEDLKAEANAQGAFNDLEDEARLLIKQSPSDEIKAAYFALTGSGSSTMDLIEARNGLIAEARIRPEDVISAFGNDRVRIKFRLQTAINQEYVYVGADAITLIWTDSHKPCLTIPMGADMAEEFATFVISGKGVDVYARLDELLTK